MKSEGEGQVVLASFQGTLTGHGDVAGYVADFALAARLLKETGVKIIEANLSCPNEGTANLLCYDKETARRVLEAVREEIGDLPLMIKLAYFVADEDAGPVTKALVENEPGKNLIAYRGWASESDVAAAISQAAGVQVHPRVISV